MSFQAMAWAVKQETDSPLSKLILLMIANYADEK
ncbi:MAG TPA: helix-turn-helix domain-containing protein, partial [Maribacter sp.]|nr:helix-turn-helix domain-containing protein [Maribacter sp.]